MPKDTFDETESPSANVLVPKKSGNSLLPIILVVVLVPALCWAVMDFLTVPKLKSSITENAGQVDEAKLGKTSTGAPGDHNAEFGVTVVNLAASGSTRYLRTNFVVASNQPKIEDIIKENHSKLKDAAITVLAARTVADIENPGGRDAVRKDLISQFNRLLGGEVVDQIYFSEFVIQ